MRLKQTLLSLIAATLCLSVSAQQQVAWDEAYKQADEILKRLTLEEKLNFTRGYSSFFFYGVPDKGVPYIYLSDASQGVHMRNNLADPNMVKQLERSTAFPCPIMLTATFNPALAYDYAKSVGEECRAGGVEVLLGPGVNIYRNSQCARNFEYMGEDPKLASAMAVNYIKGMQSTGTAACMKHFVCNNTEFYRRRSNSIVDERALHEIYLPAFKAGIDAGVAYIMTSYNRLNGEWAGQSDYVNHTLLRKELGFKGCIMTDWTSVYDTEKLIKSGQNVEMPGRKELIDEIKELMKQGKITEKDIDAMIRPMFATSVAFGFYGREKYRPELLENFAKHAEVATAVASEGTVLLKNNGILPLTEESKILVTGYFLDKMPRGGGSAATEGYDNIMLRDAVKAQFGTRATVSAKPTDDEIKAADVVLLSIGTMDAEAMERPFALPKEEEAQIEKILALNPNTIVLVNSGSGIRMSRWNDKAAAILYGWYPGQNGFAAITAILAGKINPSGKLPMTLECEFKDSPAVKTMPAGAEFYNKAPRAYNERMIQLFDVNYDESVLVGYRWYEAKNIKPLYPFGFGLSYTSFTLSKATTSSKVLSTDKPLKVSITLTNTGKRAGAEVVQLYVGENTPTVVRPKKELKAFKKVNLEAGKSTKVDFELNKSDLAFWNDQSHAWTVNAGKYTISLGTSSADIAATLDVEVQ